MAALDHEALREVSTAAAEHTSMLCTAGAPTA